MIFKVIVAAINILGWYTMFGVVNQFVHPRTRNPVAVEQAAKQTASAASGNGAQQGNSFVATHTVATNDKSNLRVRAGQSTSANIVATLKQGSPVQVLETGESFKDSDGYTGNWQRVVTADGTQGWCFGAYLVPISSSPNRK